jgi:hypothetical protein
VPTFDNMKNRPTADLIIVFISGIIGFSIMGLVVALIVSFFTGDSNDHDLAKTLLNSLVDLTASLITGVVGYIAGKTVGRNEADQEGKTHE